MRVLFITHYTRLYGANRSLLALIDGLTSLGVEPFVLAPAEGDITDELRNRGVEYAVFPFQWWMARKKRHALKRLIRNLKLVKIISGQIKRWNISLVYSNSSVTPIGAFIAIKLHLPHIWHIREFGNLDYNLQHDFGYSFFRFLLKRSTAIITVSRSLKNHYALHKLKLPVYVVYNGVQFAKDTEVREPHKPTGARYTFAILGLIHPQKGQEQAIRGLYELTRRKCKRARLLVVGEGDKTYVEQLHYLCRDLNVEECVSFLGYIKDPFQIYRRTNAILMCSPYEAMGRVTAEAMIAGCPVIGYRNAGTEEILDEGRTGLLYDGTIDNLAQCMEKLMNNKKLSYRLSRRAREKAIKEFTIESYTYAIYNIIKRYVV